MDGAVRDLSIVPRARLAGNIMVKKMAEVVKSPKVEKVEKVSHGSKDERIQPFLSRFSNKPKA